MSSAEPTARADETVDGFAVAVIRQESSWRCEALADSALTSLDDAVTQLRQLRAAGAAFGLIDVDDDFFVIVRPGPRAIAVMLSDATAVVDYELAEDIADLVNLEVSDEDADGDPWPAGDLAILADLGLPESVLAVIAGEADLYADEQLGMVAQRLGFAEEFAAVLDTLGR